MFSVSCPDDYMYESIMHVCFKLYNEWRVREYAVNACRADGAELLRIDSPTKQDAVQRALIASKLLVHHWKPWNYAGFLPSIAPEKPQ